MGKFMDFVNQVVKDTKEMVKETQEIVKANINAGASTNDNTSTNNVNTSTTVNSNVSTSTHVNTNTAAVNVASNVNNNAVQNTAGVQTGSTLDALIANAGQGNLHSARTLHSMYANGEGVPRDMEQAYFWARVCSDMGDYNADYNVGVYFRDGIGVAPDIQKAWKYFERAARKGVTGAQQAYEELTAKFYVISSRPANSTMESIKEKATANRDIPEKYFSYCLQLANFEEDQDGKNWVALCYREGNGTPVNMIASVYWLKEAVEKGNPFAFYNLAGMYESGCGVLVDYDEAIRLYRIAEQRGHGWATERIQSLSTINTYTAQQLCDKAEKMGRIGSVSNANDFLYQHYMELAAKKGAVRGWLMTANGYRQQHGVGRDYIEAAYYYKKGIILNPRSNAGREYPLRLFAQMCALGQGMPQNMQLANYYYREARQYAGGFAARYPDITTYIRESSNTSNPYKKARETENGDFYQPNLEAAIRGYEACANEGNKSACGELIRIYQSARDMEKLDYYLQMYFSLGQNIQDAAQKDERILYELLVKEFNFWNKKACDGLQGYMMEELTGKIFHSGGEYFAGKCLEIAQKLGVANTNEIWNRLQREKEQRWAAMQNVQEEPAEEETPQIILSGEDMSMLEKLQKEQDELLKDPAYQNAQLSPEKPALADGEGEYWEVFEKIRKLESEGNYDDILDIGFEYFALAANEETEGEEASADSTSGEDVETGDDEEEYVLFDENSIGAEPEYDEEYEMKQRIAINCFKTAMLHGEVDGLCQLGVAFFYGVGVPRNLKLAQTIFERVKSLEVEEFEESINEILADVKEELEWESEETRESMLNVGMRYRNMANTIEEAHYPEEEWLLYEYYDMSAYKNGNNGMFVSKYHSKYFSKRINWEQVLAMPWESFLDQSEEEEEIEVESLKSAAAEDMPENLDHYFEDMIGMESVKEQLEKIYHTVAMQALRDKVLEEKGEEPQEQDRGYNFVLLGNPGTGKTTVARIIAQILYDIKVRKTDTFVEVGRADIVSDHIGGTAKRMQETLDKVEGGTLFIDEAYTLYREDEDNDFGQEAISTLMKDMEDNRNSYSVIIAGYREPMMNMIKHANSGFSSRFTYVIELPDYTEDALIEIAHSYIDRQKFEPAEDVDAAIKKCIDRDKLDETFGNARYIRELVNKAIENQSSRLKEQSDYDMEELFILKGEDFWQDAYEEDDVEKYLAQLNSLIGLESVKEEVNSLINHITVQKEMQKRGLVETQDFGTLHMAFKGNPGTGKTTVARILGKLYAAMGILKRGDVFVECTRADLVGKYQGHTADSVTKVVESAMGGILFIDEAYALVDGPGDSYGLEAVNALVTEMENNRDSLMVILAGYTQELDEFLKQNPGLRSRVPKDLYFADYRPDELYEIALKMLEAQNLVITEEAGEVLRRRLLAESMLSNFGNARGVRNMIESIRRKQNVRIAQLLKADASAVTNEMLVTIEAEDVEK